MNFEGYSTYQIFNDKHEELIKQIEVPRGFSFDFREDPSFMNWISKDGSGECMSNHKPDEEYIEKFLVDNYRAKELIIWAKDESTAQDINNLVHGGRLLAYPCVYSNPTLPSVTNLKYNYIQENNYRQKDINEAMLFACLVALRSWNDKSLIYCIEKYRFSLNLDSFTPHSASPMYGQVFSIEDRGYEYHVRASYAFLSAYSIIEELGLEIRSSAKKPRFNSSGEWNSIVKEDILKRLLDVGISEVDTISWLIRGTPSELYKSIKPKLGIDTEWNDGEIVHDKEMKIYDAIHYASYIRNFFMAHKFDEIISYINPYDINNIQMLARRLIISKLKLWQFDRKEAGKYI